jgi:uncharacterized membrane protein
LGVPRAFSITFVQMAEFVAVAVGLRPSRRMPPEAKLRLTAFRGFFLGKANVYFGLFCEKALGAKFGHVEGRDARGRCRTAELKKGLADSQK